MAASRSLRRWWWKPVLVFLPVLGYVTWWLVATWDRVTLTATRGDIRWVSLASDGATIITRNAKYQDGKMRSWRWDRDTGIQPHHLSAEILPDIPVALCGRVLASLIGSENGRDQSVWLWDVAADREIRRMGQLAFWASVLAFSPDGSLLAAIGSGVVVFDVATGKAIRTIDPKTQLCCGGITSAGVVVAETEEGKLVAWAPGTDPPQEGPRLNPYLKHLEVCPSREEVAIEGLRYGEIEVHSLPDFKVVARFRPRHSTIHSLRYSPDGEMLAVTQGPDSHPWPASWGWVDVYDIPSYEIRKTFRWFYGAPHITAFSPDGRFAVVGTRPGVGGGLSVWRVRD